MPVVRPPAVAGSFYPGDADRLAATVDHLLAEAETTGSTEPRALIVPHAGYAYSGPIAASGYARLSSAARRIRRVLLLGPSHFVPFRGLALPEASALATPLGEVPVDRDAAELAGRFSQVAALSGAHAREHSLEVQLPFLQRMFERVSVLPLVVGSASAQEIAEVLDALWTPADTLLLVSSDLSHYLPYARAAQVDRATAGRIASLSPEPLTPEEACGAAPINGLLAAARRRRLRVEPLDLRSSGDTAGGRDQVVGYGAFAFYEPGA